ncbi:TIGR02391 family protein [Shewanella algae]|uniref:TIGR02391 family protein n=1 Tax=Shewanella algae TaxID=38313 RepID=UPI001F2511CA|nr:TIGR02391 family protein [Shewanella algae]MCE9776351.1 TIGR02391 family protein [Shewanella algae]
MGNTTLEMRFDPKTIEHLGVKMYSTLPPALSELISNAYDADSGEVTIKLVQSSGVPKSITVKDDGEGMSLEEIQTKFLVIGRNRRDEVGDIRTKKFGRLATGKKGLGKLALFGLANKITVRTIKGGLLNSFELSWEALLGSSDTYKPNVGYVNHPTTAPDGTEIKLSELKRKSAFDVVSLADSLSRIFNVDSNFKISIKLNDEKPVEIDFSRRYATIEMQFEWDVERILNDNYAGVSWKIITSKTPIPPSTGLRGVTIFSRNKMVNLPEYFSDSSSSHFYQYVTGWIDADFIDEIKDDVISTNRQSINWDNEDMSRFREYLKKMLSRVNSEWRLKRAEEKAALVKGKTGIDSTRWFSTMKPETRSKTQKIVDIITSDETFEKAEDVVKTLYELVPEYPDLHWRHLNPALKERVKAYYANEQYGEAAILATNIYMKNLRTITKIKEDGQKLIHRALGGSNPIIKVADSTTETGENLQAGQTQLSLGLIAGFRNPIAHSPIDEIIPSTFNDVDCLDVLSLASYLISRVERRIKTGDKQDSLGDQCGKAEVLNEGGKI